MCVYKPNRKNLKIRKYLYLKKNLRLCLILDYSDTQFSNFAIEYLREKERVRETVFACSYGAQVESYKQKNRRKSRDTVPALKAWFYKKVLHCWRTVTNNFLFFMIFCMLRVHREGDIAKFPTDLAFRKFKSKLFKNVCRKSEANFQSVSLL